MLKFYYENNRFGIFRIASEKSLHPRKILTSFTFPRNNKQTAALLCACKKINNNQDKQNIIPRRGYYIHYIQGKHLVKGFKYNIIGKGRGTICNVSEPDGKI